MRTHVRASLPLLLFYLYTFKNAFLQFYLLEYHSCSIDEDEVSEELAGGDAGQ